MRRISVGSAMARVAFTAFRKSAEEIFRAGHFGSFAGSDPLSYFNDRFRRHPPR